MNHQRKAKLAVGMVLCLLLSNILVLPGSPKQGESYDSPRITAYASGSNADMAVVTASNSNCSSAQGKEHGKTEKRLLRSNAETTVVVGSGEEGSYDSLADLFSDLGEDIGILTIELAGDTSDTGMVIVPKDKGIDKVILCGDADYQIGTGENSQAGDLVANGIPMRFEAGSVYRLVGGGCDTDVESTDLTVTGGLFHSCAGGGIVTQSDSHARVKNTVKLTFDGYIMENSEYEYSQIYGGGQILTNIHQSDISVGKTNLAFLDSNIALDMIMGGHYITGRSCTGTLDSSSITVQNSHITLGDGMYGAHAINGQRREDMQTATCGDIQIKVCDSTVEGDIGGGSFATADGIIDIGSIDIYAENSNIASIQAGGIYMGAFHFGIQEINVTLDSCIVNGSHMFEEEFSMVGAGCYVGEDMTMPENDLHADIGNISYTFLNTILDDAGDEGDEGLLFLPAGYIEPKAVVSIDKTALDVCGTTEFSIDSGTLDELLIQPPKGAHFTVAQINGEEIPRDEQDTARLTNLEAGTVLHLETEPIKARPQPPMSIENTVGGEILKTIGEPDFTLTVSGGIEELPTHFISSDPSVAEINEYGEVTIKRVGKTTLTAFKQSSDYEKASASVILTVEKAVAALLPDPEMENSNYVLVAKKVQPEVQKIIDKEIFQRPEFNEEDAQIVNMEIELIDVATSEPVTQAGATFTIAYPLEEMKAKPEQYSIHILHIPSNGQPYLVPIEKTSSGIKITVENFSPFVMSYKKLADIDEPQTPEEPDTPAVDPKPVVPDEPDDPKTPLVPSHRTDSSDDDDEVLTGRWIHNMKGWWYRNPDGTYPRGAWAFLPYNGSYQWYLFDEQGYMITGWAEWNHNKYYLHALSDNRMGYMYTGWHQKQGNWYYFNAKPGRNCGILLVNTVTPDGYLVDQNGVWVNSINKE